jgi:hypothetical protein
MAKPIDKLVGISCPHLWSTSGIGFHGKTTYHCNLFPKAETVSDEPCSIIDANNCILSLNPDTVKRMTVK